MLPRIVAFLLAFLMLWSGLAVTAQRFAETLAWPEQTTSQSGDSRHSDGNGSMDDHVVDDQPAQPFGEPSLVFAALLDTAAPGFAGDDLKATCPARPAEATWVAPFLEGVRRPPRSA
jgi:hypothetical protein